MNLLAANANDNLGLWSHSGSGIYAGHMGTLDIFVSTTATTKILIANVPANPSLLPIENDIEEIEVIENTNSMENLSTKLGVDKNVNEKYNHQVLQENMTQFTIEFLDFSKRLSYNGTICNGDDFCCHYDIDVIDSGSHEGTVNIDVYIKTYRSE